MRHTFIAHVAVAVDGAELQQVDPRAQEARARPHDAAGEADAPDRDQRDDADEIGHALGDDDRRGAAEFLEGGDGFEMGGTEPGYESVFKGNEIIVKTTRALSENRNFFINFTWPSGGFSDQSQWIKVMKQHPRIPLCAFSAVLLLWALVTLLARGLNRAPVAVRNAG